MAPDWSLVGCGWLVADGAADRVDAVLREFADDTGAANVAAVAGALGVDAGLLADYLSTVGCRFLFRGHVLTRDKSRRVVRILWLAFWRQRTGNAMAQQHSGDMYRVFRWRAARYKFSVFVKVPEDVRHVVFRAAENDVQSIGDWR